jgi:hypothetical protein
MVRKTLTTYTASAKCESGAAKAEGKLIACIMKCHASRASGKLADDTAENSCENGLAVKSCAASFTLAISKLSGCPACINGTTMASLAGLTESLIDANNFTIYCSGVTTTTTTTTTLPFQCNDLDGGCGTCGSGGICSPSCPNSSGLRCIAPTSADCHGSCGSDQDCAASPGTICSATPFNVCPGACCTPCSASGAFLDESF